MLPRMRFVVRLLLVLVVVLLLIQLVPYGRDHDNPKSVQEPKWSSAATRQLTQQGCFDCHSNLTEWPWYTNVAPVSWLTTRDVDDGRAVLNFSEWQRAQDADLQDVIDAIRDEDMPPLQYRLIHKDARLSDNERQALEAGLTATWVKDPPGPAGGS
jgi:mono/diheme cytochrome c family protein